ncbi:TonB-dependent receptor domain-containing protein [Cytophagales bacterium SYC-11]
MKNILLFLFGLNLNRDKLCGLIQHKPSVMTHKYLFLFLFLAITRLSFASNPDAGGNIKGTIKTGDGLAVVYANILLEGPNKSTFTNDLGEFSFNNIPAGDYVIKISSVGFVSIRQSIEVVAGEVINLDLTFEEDITAMPQITILSSKDRLFTKTPGSVGYINNSELKLLNPISGNEALRRVSGLHVVDEEGAGMRVNVGIRGLNPDRSRSVLMLEDGVPVALNPYGEPEMYYSPAIDRMAGVEVLKGSGQILYGPQTIGGVINYITADPPAEEEFGARIIGGQSGYFSGLLSYGNTVGKSGVQVNFLRKQADNLGPTEFRINDFSSKFKFNFNDRSTLGVKIGAYQERSNSTYVGLTQPMYEAGDQDYVRIAPNDELAVNRYSISFHHDYKLSENTTLKSLAFAYTTTRNWRRQDFSNDASASRQTGVIWGDREIPGGAIFMREGTGNRNRQFEVAGFEQKIISRYSIGNLPNELTAGYRYMHEKAFEQRVNGTKADAKSGALVSDEIRTGNAISLFAQNKFIISDKFSVNAGLRGEIFNYERDILRNAFSGVVKDTSIVADNNVSQLIPGLGFTYQASEQLAVFGGAHRGFAPPRVKDAITATGSVIELDAELSWNYELGFRSTLIPGTFLELTGFYMDFSNQIIPVAESAGGTGAGLVNAGRTLHAGVETALSVDISNLLNTSHTFTYDINATFVATEYTEDRFKSVSGEQINIKGNRLPYAPSFIFSSGFTWQAPAGYGLRFTGTYVGQQFTDEINSVIPSADGRTGELPSYFVLDATAQYKIPNSQATIQVSAKNLLDQRYISTRRPQGIRVGLPRFITAGVDIKF